MNMCCHVAVQHGQLDQTHVCDIRRICNHAKTHTLGDGFAYGFPATHLDGHLKGESLSLHGLFKHAPGGRTFLANDESLLVQVPHAHSFL